MKRRVVLAASAASLLAPPWVRAQSAWPARGPIRLIAQFPPGGLVDVEFAVQMLQLRHGHAEPRVRRRGTRRALEALAACGLLDPASATALRDGWDFLRVLEGRLRIERDQPVEAFAADPATLASLAQRMGFAGSPSEAAAALRTTHQRHRDAIRAAFTRVFDEAVRA